MPESLHVYTSTAPWLRGRQLVRKPTRLSPPTEGCAAAPPHGMGASFEAPKHRPGRPNCKRLTLGHGRNRESLTGKGVAPRQKIVSARGVHPGNGIVQAFQDIRRVGAGGEASAGAGSAASEGRPSLAPTSPAHPPTGAMFPNLPGFGGPCQPGTASRPEGGLPATAVAPASPVLRERSDRLNLAVASFRAQHALPGTRRTFRRAGPLPYAGYRSRSR